MRTWHSPLTCYKNDYKSFTQTLVLVTCYVIMWGVVRYTAGSSYTVAIQPASCEEFSKLCDTSFSIRFPPFQISVNLIPKLAMSPLEMKTYPNGKDQDEKKFNQV